MLLDCIFLTIWFVINLLFGFSATALISLANLIALSILYKESTRIAIGTSLLTFLNFFNSSHLKLDIINFEGVRLDSLKYLMMILFVS